MRRRRRLFCFRADYIECRWYAFLPFLLHALSEDKRTLATRQSTAAATTTCPNPEAAPIMPDRSMRVQFWRSCICYLARLYKRDFFNLLVIIHLGRSFS